MNPFFGKIAAYVKANCSADDYTLRVDLTDRHDTRFGQNAITQHLAGLKTDVILEVAFGNKTGSCRINQSSEENLKYLVETAESMAKLNQPDPEYVPSASASDYQEISNAADATRLLSPERMVNIVQASIANGIAKDAKTSGMTTKVYSEAMLTTKNGFVGTYDMSRFEHSMTLKKGEVETKVSFSSKDFASFKLIEQISRLNDQFTSLGTPQVFEAQKIPVILRPPAIAELMMFMLWQMDRRDADEGMTPFTGQLGKQFFGKDFSIASKLSHDLLAGAPFTGSGIVNRDTWWIKDGILNEMPTERYWAQKLGVQPSEMFNIYIPGSDVSEEQMMQMVPRGLIVNRFWYIRYIDSKSGELTGMTRDGVLYFEDGKIQHAVNNLRFNEIPYLATHRILAKGAESLADSHTVLPTVLIDGFNFVDKTSF
ncbi:MAG: hypothetical protein CVU48_00340 [Candidatus Cloacimonetes bacterium HGW-Cloacimonetes-1]|jgi:predicted Zn-dependent protease|nr:MAG: hypothetical protein CVU48_00340 [Candidatus Cloacimonetes bacterium HGW-Cloacimonetes-1]